MVLRGWVLKTLGNLCYVFLTVLQYPINNQLNQMSINMSENHWVECISGSLGKLSIHLSVIILSYTHNVGFFLGVSALVVLTSICLSCHFHVLTFLDNFCEVRNQSDKRMTEIFYLVSTKAWKCNFRKEIGYPIRLFPIQLDAQLFTKSRWGWHSD